ncbi:MAG: hypothetical protein RIT45_256 [Pseudomonadota bacterium]
MSTAPTPTSSRRVGVLLVNLGTPDAPETPAVRRYLREFLMDPRVVDIPAVARWMLVHLIILPFRPARSAAAYRTIWGPRGSPLLTHGQDLRAGLAAALGADVEVRLAMRYGNPSIESVLDGFARDGVDRIIVLPLFPQYSSAAFGSAAARVMELAGERWNVPQIEILPPFFDDPGFVAASAAIAERAFAPYGGTSGIDHVLLSFHGVPERQCRRSDPTGAHCLVRPDCCEALVDANRHCYRAQCVATAKAIAVALGLSEDAWSIGFQSRLGRTPWIRPYTDESLAELGRRKLGRIAVLEPSFVADCLETVEEIGDRGREIFREAGGGELVLVPCLNAEEIWVEAVSAMLRPRLDGMGVSPAAAD